MTSPAHFMTQAIEQAKQCLHQPTGGPFGAVVVKNDQIVGVGHNQVTALNDPTAHAEMMAIRNACQTLNTFNLEGCVIYTSCEPCPMCLGGIYWSRIDSIVYGANRLDAAAIGFDDQFFYDELAKPIEQRQVPMECVERAGALEVFSQWAAKEDKINY